MLGAFVLPDEPRNTRLLTSTKREMASGQMKRDTVEVKEDTAVCGRLREAASDPRLWILTAMQHFQMAASNHKNFFPTIVETLGIDEDVTLALTCLPYIIAGIVLVVWSVVWSVSSGRFNERTWHIIAAKLIPGTVFILESATLNIGARYFAMCLFATGVYSSWLLWPLSIEKRNGLIGRTKEGAMDCSDYFER